MNEEIEIWKDVLGYEGRYQISSLGRVKSLPKTWNTGIAVITQKERILKNDTVQGYYEVSLVKNNKRKHGKVHRLVATAFIPNKKSKPFVNHIDGNRKNNSVDNLEWSTVLENNRHAWDYGLCKHYGEMNNFSKLKLEQVENIYSYKKSGISQRKVAELFKISQSSVSRIWGRKRWKQYSI